MLKGVMSSPSLVNGVTMYAVLSLATEKGIVAVPLIVSTHEIVKGLPVRIVGSKGIGGDGSGKHAPCWPFRPWQI
jgi:hypothetical protein